MNKIARPLTDAELQALLTRLRQADRSALRELYASYGGALLSIVHGRVSDPALAEEVLQDTFLKIWRSIDQYDANKGRFFTWAAQIARRAALDKTKTLKFKRNRDTQSIEPNADRAEYGLVESQIVDSGLRDTVGQLKERRRMVIECFYYENLTQKETSEKLDMPLGSVKTELRNAIRDLRILLAKDQSI